MNEKERLAEINKIAHSIWDWMCERETAIVALIPPIDKIMELSEFKEEDDNRASKKKEMTTIQIDVSTRDSLKKLKAFPREPYEDVLKKLLNRFARARRG